jgi:hypothetical protein
MRPTQSRRPLAGDDYRRAEAGRVQAGLRGVVSSGRPDQGPGGDADRRPEGQRKAGKAVKPVVRCNGAAFTGSTGFCPVLCMAAPAALLRWVGATLTVRPTFHVS